jgi:hypothetical protein
MHALNLRRMNRPFTALRVATIAMRDSATLASELFFRIGAAIHCAASRFAATWVCVRTEAKSPAGRVMLPSSRIQWR